MIQDGQCTYNVRLRRVHATFDAVDKQSVLHNLILCICSLSYAACNAHAPYCHRDKVLKNICSSLQPCTPEDGHNGARNILSYWFINKS